MGGRWSNLLELIIYFQVNKLMVDYKSLHLANIFYKSSHAFDVHKVNTLSLDESNAFILMTLGSWLLVQWCVSDGLGLGP